jgi:hypothetical protein
MDIFDTKEEVKNSTILLLVLGMLLSYVINSVDNILDGLFRIIFSLLPLKVLTLTSISFRGLIFITLLFILFRLFSSKKLNNSERTIFLSLKAFRTIGLISILIIASSIILNLYVKTNFGEAIELSKVQDTDITEIAYLSLVENGLVILTNVTLFIIYFVILFQKKVNDAR